MSRSRNRNRIEYGTFEEYCSAKWGFSKTQANRLVQSAAIVAELTPIGVIPQTESQTRPLTKLKDPEQQREAWKKAVNWSIAASRGDLTPRARYDYAK